MPAPIYMPPGPQAQLAGSMNNMLQQLVMMKIKQNMDDKAFDKRAKAEEIRMKGQTEQAKIALEEKRLYTETLQKEKENRAQEDKKEIIDYKNANPKPTEGTSFSPTGDLKNFEIATFGKAVPGKRGTPEYKKQFLEFINTKKSASPYTQAMLRRLEAADRQFGTNLRKEFEGRTEVKDFKEIEFRYDVMDKAFEESKTTGNFVAVDQALITTFNKITDPDSVVRESEYARTANDLALINKIKGKIIKIGKGGPGLTHSDRTAIHRLAGQFKDVSHKKYRKTHSEYMGYFESAGIPGTNYMTQEATSQDADALMEKYEF